ncbi:MAG: hypothetical protein HYZ40_15475 [Rhodospirillales bacterium]|nr:hypothetical protein [Rhodospirillales bacterium]
MSNVAAFGGSLIKQIGTRSEIAAFFELINRHKEKSIVGDLALVTDRLYRRTVAREDLDALAGQLDECRRIFRAVPVVPGSWDEFNLGEKSVGLDRRASNLAAAFHSVFSALDRVLEGAQYDKRHLGYDRPIRLQAFEGPKSYEHQYMKSEEFEKPDIRPIWLE